MLGAGQVAGHNVKADLAAAFPADTVTEVAGGVPASLAGYTQIYDTRYDNTPPLTAGEMGQYVAFLNAASGNTLFLMGENTYYAARDLAITQFIALAGGGTITPPARNNLATSYLPETVHAPLNTTPNALTSVTFADCGVVTSAGNGAFATTEANGTSGCSLYFEPNRLTNALPGALVVVFDVNFMYSAPTGNGAANEISFRQNLEQFVAAPPPGQPVVAAPSVVAVPTLSEFGMVLLAMALATLGVLLINRNAIS
jgi:hypothetical protein